MDCGPEPCSSEGGHGTGNGVGGKLFQYTHQAPPQNLGRQEALGEGQWGPPPPGPWLVGAPFLSDSHAQAIRRVTKLFIFPPVVREEDAGSRENPAVPL